jgi:hypothetical protein
MRRVLMVSPHFPPDTSAAAHRVRLLAPHLPACGWEPTVLTVEPRAYEGRLDPGLARLVPADLRVIRARAWSSGWTRLGGVSDLGLRAYRGLRRRCLELLACEPFDALFITMYPTYPALLGPVLKRRFGLPFVLDYQDPWVGEWGRSAGPDGRPDLKSRLSRWLAERLEPRVLPAVDAITAVSAGTYEPLLTRYPWLDGVPCSAIPLGGEPGDFERLRRQPRPNPYFDPKDGHVHLCYVGTLLPLGIETLRAVLRAVALLRRRQPSLYARLRLHFVGTSNQTAGDAPSRVLPIARAIGVEDRVTEIAPRVDYLDALTIQTQASAILLMGSSERHYTASKLYPALLAERPILAVYHEASPVVNTLRAVAAPPAARLVTYDDARRAESQVDSICDELAALADNPVFDPTVVRMEGLREFSASSLARQLAAALEAARGRR